MWSFQVLYLIVSKVSFTYFKEEGNQDKSIILAENVVYGSSRLGTLNRTTETMLYEIKDHLGNVRAVVGKDADGNMASIVKGRADYYPGGMQLPNEQTLDYRYGYQGEYAEQDEETGLNAFELRLYDARINRWITPDPARQYASPYLAMGNNWVSRVDPDGGEDGDGWFKRVFNKIFRKTKETTDGYIEETVLTVKKVKKAVNESFSLKNVGFDAGAGVKDFNFGSAFKVSFNGSLMNLYYNDDKERLEGGILNGGVKLSIGKKLFTVGAKGSLIEASEDGYSFGKVSASGAIDSYDIRIGTLEAYNSDSGWGGNSGVVLQQPLENRMIDIHGTGNREPQAIIGGTIKAGIKAKVEFNVDKFYSEMLGNGNMGTEWKK